MERGEPDPGRITKLLLAASGGGRDALDELIPLIYQDLRRVAAAQMRRESPGHSLQATALVHEVYVRLIDQRQANWQNRAQFVGAAASLMRRILVDHARARLADKRGGDLVRVSLNGDQLAADGSDNVDILGLHAALERLAQFSPRQERIVELRYFGGLTNKEAATAVGISEATLVREWTAAKAWLRAHLSGARTGD